MSPFTKAALISNARKMIKEYENFQGIVQISMRNISNGKNIADVDNEWIMQFWDASKNFSSEEFQLLWGRLLAQECNNPGSIPRSVIYILQRMDRADAVAFMKFSSLVVDVCGEVTPMVFEEFYNDDATYGQTGLTFDDICQLETLGLVKMEHGMFAGGYGVDLTRITVPSQCISYHGKSVKVKEEIKRVIVGTVMFTKDGCALYKAVDPKQLRGFWEEIILKHIGDYIN